MTVLTDRRVLDPKLTVRPVQQDDTWHVSDGTHVTHAMSHQEAHDSAWLHNYMATGGLHAEDRRIA